MTVKNILSSKGRDVITVEPGADVGRVVNTLAKHRIGAVIVVEAPGRVAGIVSERDIVRTLAERGPKVLEESVDTIMTRKVVTCDETETVVEIMERMTAGKFRHVPVVQHGRLVGIISIGDVVKHRLGEVERESIAMREYILTA